MKKISLMIVFTAMVLSLIAQSPNAFKYQAIARNINGEVIGNKQVSMRISILQGSTSGTSVYVEKFNKQTSKFGLIEIEIGNGNILSGSFSLIDWSAGPYFVKVDMDENGGSSYAEMGISQLLSVPFSLYAAKAGNGFSGNYADLSNKPELVTVATTGNYSDLMNLPVLSSVALSGKYADLLEQPVLFTGKYADLTDKPSLFSGSYLDLTNLPAFSAVATSGNYSDLTNKPVLFSGNYSDLTNKPSLFSGSYLDLTNLPAFSAVATSGNYSDLMNKPVLFSGNYSDLTNKPILFSGIYSDLTNKPVLFSGDYADLTDAPVLSLVATSGIYSDLKNKPVLSTVATSGNYSDLLNKPSLFSGSWNDLTNKPALSLVASSGNYSDLLNKPGLATVAISGSYSDLLNKPDFSNFDDNKNDDVLLSGSQVISGVKTFSSSINANGGINGNNKTISNVASPVNSKDVATKAYIDSMILRFGDINKLLDGGYTVQQLIASGQSLSALLNAGVTVTSLISAGVSLNDLNSAGVGVGLLRQNGVSETSLQTAGLIGTVNDVNGNTYQWVKIGTQTWMAENLKTVNYADNTPITEGKADTNVSYTAKYWFNYNDDAANKSIYGLLYTWAAAVKGNTGSLTIPSGLQGVCPNGWHMPSDGEWTLLYNFISTHGYSGNEGTTLKSTSGWNGGNGSDVFGFKALPAGFRLYSGTYSDLGNAGNFWSATTYDLNTNNGLRRYLLNSSIIINKDDYGKRNGFSIRCVKN
jgi:uncharacterized protein (TIGR02145 family)